MNRIVDLSPPVPDGFRGPPSTDVRVRLETSVTPGYWQASLASRNVHSGCHVESSLHTEERGGGHRRRGARAGHRERAVVLDLTPVEPRDLIGPPALEDAAGKLAGIEAAPARAFAVVA